MLNQMVCRHEASTQIRKMIYEQEEIEGSITPWCSRLLKCIDDKKIGNYYKFIDNMFLFIDNVVESDSQLAQVFIDCNIIEILLKRIQETNDIVFYGMAFFIIKITCK